MITRSVTCVNDVRLLNLPRTLEQYVADQTDIRDCDEAAEVEEDFLLCKSGPLNRFGIKSWSHAADGFSAGDLKERNCFTISEM